MRRARRLLVALVLLTTLSACGGGGDADEGAPAPTTTVAAAGGGGGTGPATTAAPAAGGTYCDHARAYSAAYASAVQRFATPGNPADLRSFFEGAADAARQAAESAPNEIRADITIVATQTRALADELARVNYEIARVSPEVIQRFMAAELTAASGRVAAYSRDLCGVSG